MQSKKHNLNNKIAAVVTALMVGAVVPAARADTAMTAGVVLDSMSVEEQHAYVVGIVEGFAYYTALESGEGDDRIACIYGWYYEDVRKSVLQITQAFARFRDHYPAAIIFVLINRECGAP